MVMLIWISNVRRIAHRIPSINGTEGKGLMWDFFGFLCINELLNLNYILVRAVENKVVEFQFYLIRTSKQNLKVNLKKEDTVCVLFEKVFNKVKFDRNDNWKRKYIKFRQMFVLWYLMRFNWIQLEMRDGNTWQFPEKFIESGRNFNEWIETNLPIIDRMIFDLFISHF